MREDIIAPYTASVKAKEKEALPDEGVSFLEKVFIGDKALKRKPVMKAESICITQSIKPILSEEKIPIPTVLRIKAGPALLQNARLLSASRLFISLSLYKDVQSEAPIGYPLIKPKINAENEFLLTEKIGFIILLQKFGSASESLNPMKSFVITRKGKSDGITEVAQRESEVLTAVVTFVEKKRRA